jgi:hypothetical protein
VITRYGWQATAKAGLCHFRMTEIQRCGKGLPQQQYDRERTNPWK